VARVVADLGERRLQKPGGVALTPCFTLGADPAEAKSLMTARVLFHQAQGADDFAVGSLEPEVAGLGEQIATVEFRIWGGLLDDEHLDTQLEQLI
jgi:hypothetical protein